MSTTVAIGATHALEGFALAGVDVVWAATADEVDEAWEALGPDVALVILSPDAAATLGGRVAAATSILTVVMP